MRLNPHILALGATLGLLGIITTAAATPTSADRPSSSGNLSGGVIAPWNYQPSAGSKPAPVRYAAKQARKADAKKKPAAAAQPDPAAIGQAVRQFLTSNQDVLRSAIIEVLRNDSDVKKILSGSGEKSAAQSPAAAPPPTPTTPPASSPSAASSSASMDQKRIEEIIHNYLVLHPEVLQEAIAELEKRQALADAEKHRDAIKQHADLLFNSPRQVVLGNPHGDVTFVEFFDYNCAYCKKALTDMMDLMKTDPKLKVVLKEFPVLGKPSVDVAQVATAVRMQDKSGKKYLEFHQKLLSGRGQIDKARAMAVAKEIGLDMNRLEKDSGSEEARASIEEALKLAEALGLTGTPSYVVGPNVVIGAVGVTQLREKVNTARCGKAEC